jgi:hypothetical protein
LKICAKCGKANDVTRKYCTRCGASLIRLEEDVKPPVEEAPSEPPTEEIVGPPAEEQYVAPSQAVPEEIAMEDTVVTTEKEAVAAPASEGMDIPSEEEVMPPPDTDEHEKGRETVREILAKVKAAEARVEEQQVVQPPEEEMEIPEEEEAFPEEEEASMVEEVEIEVEEEYEEEYEEEPTPPPTPVAHKEEIPPVSKPAVSMETFEPTRDEKIRVIEADIKAFTIEHQQLRSEFDKIKSRLDEEVERYHIAAETKRTRADGIERELRLAKKEYDDANKEHKNAENRRKKELSDAEKRIRDVEKKMQKAQGAKDKRIQELEKERRKREEEAAKS